MDSVLSQGRLNGVHLLYKLLVQPRGADEDACRRERVLNILLIVSIGLSGALTLSDIYESIRLGASYQGVPVWLPAFICAFFCVLLALSRRGAVRFSSFALLAAYALPVAYTAYRWGADVPLTLLAYPILITMASVLIGTRFSLILTGMISLFILGLSYAQIHQGIETLRYWRAESFTMPDAIVSVVLCISVALVAWVSNRELERSLDRARASERALLHERDQLEIKVEERTRELRQLQMEKMSQQYRFIEFGRLAAGFFHDMATPLNAVSMQLERLQSTPGDDLQGMRPHLNRVLGTSRRLETFLLEIRKRLRHEDTLELFSLNEEIRNLVQILDYKARKLNVALNIEAPEDIVIHGNPVKFSQIMGNLICNGIDAYEGASESALPREVRITLRLVDDQVHLRVQDWGCGIATEHQQHIFEPFYTTKQVDKGTGIGLTITKQIVEKDLQGSLTLESQLGNGTIFTVIFPASIKRHV